MQAGIIIPSVMEPLGEKGSIFSTVKYEIKNALPSNNVRVVTANSVAPVMYLKVQDGFDMPSFSPTSILKKSPHRIAAPVFND